MWIRPDGKSLLGVAVSFVLVMTLVGCQDDSWTRWSAHPETCPCDGSNCEEEGEHGEEGDEHGEESGTRYAKDETLDEVFKGARLVMSYDAGSNLFKGTVTNTTENMLCDVRVEVHLDNGLEIGPTDKVDLQAGDSVDVELSPDDGHKGEGEH